MRISGYHLGRILSATAALLLAAVACAASAADRPHALALRPDAFQHYIEAFKNQDEELYPQHISNAIPGVPPR